MTAESLALLLKMVFIVTAMLWIGVSLVPNAGLSILQDRRLMGRVFVANWLLCPLLALGVTSIFHLSSEVATGLKILAVAPGGLNAIQFSGKVKGEIAAAATVMLVLFGSSLVATPIAALVFWPPGSALIEGYRWILVHAAGYVILPILIGSGIQQALPRWAHLLGRPLNIISTLAFACAAVLTFSVKQAAKDTIGFEGVAAMLTFIVGSMAIGWTLGGPNNSRRGILAITTSNRNVLVCLLIAITLFPGSSMDAVFLSFLALVIPANMAFTLFHAIKEKRLSFPQSRTSQ